jgi:hypothetical protein
MGDPSLVVTEAIIRRYYCFPLHLFRSSSILFSNLRVFLLLLVMESWKKLLSISHGILLNLNSATVYYLCYAGYINKSIGGMVLATASPAPQVAGNSMLSLHIMLWLVASPIK